MRSFFLALLVGACGSSPPPKQPPPSPPPARAKATETERSGRSDVEMTEDEAARFAEMLTAERQGPRDGDLSQRREGASLKQQIDEVKASGAKVAIGDGRPVRGDGGTQVGTSAGTRIDAATPPPVAPSGPTARITISSAFAHDKTTLTKDVVIAKIRSVYMAGVKRCYTTYLKKDPSARGKIVLKLGVDDSGRASGTAARFNSEVDACITSLMGRWRFPIAKDDHGDVTVASFEITLQMVPD